MVRSHEFGVEEVKLVVVCPPENTAYFNHITSAAMRTKLPEGKSLAGIMRATLRRQESFAVVSPAELLAVVQSMRFGPATNCWYSYQADRYGW